MLNLDKSGGRTQAGLRKDVRKQRFWHLFAYIDPDLLQESAQPPPEIQSSLEDVMGPERMSGNRLKLRLHPLLNRWCLFERVLNPKGAICAYRIVSIFHAGGVDDYCPKDLLKGAAHVTGIIGDFRMPTRRDFEVIEGFDVVKYGPVAVENRAAAPELETERDKEREFEDFTHDFHYYYWWQAMEDAQSEFGCRGRITYGQSEDDSPYRWKIEQKNGYQIRTKLTDPAERDKEVLRREKEGTRKIDIHELDRLNERIKERLTAKFKERDEAQIKQALKNQLVTLE